MKMLGNYFNTSFVLNIFILFNLSIFVGGNQLPVRPGRPPNIPPDIEAIRNFDDYKPTDNQKERVHHPASFTNSLTSLEGPDL